MVFCLVVEFIEAIKKTDDINDHVLSEETETKQWFSQSPVENVVASSEDLTFDAEAEKRVGERISRKMPLALLALHQPRVFNVRSSDGSSVQKRRC